MSSQSKSFKEVKSLLAESNIPSHSTLFEISDKVSDILMTEIKPYRQENSKGQAGGLLDFHQDSLPVIVVPDLHARPFFLLNILNFKLENGNSIFKSLEKKEIRLVFVGDILHTERNTRQRWDAVTAEFDSGLFTGPAISAEMQEGLSLLCGLMKLKTLFPEHVHILKGNHENIYNVTEDGDNGFRKFADEGNMCRTFVQEYYGDDILYMIHCFEKHLPFLFFGKKCIVSHAEPQRSFSKEEILNARLHPDVIEGLTWTANDYAEEGSVCGVIKNLTGNDDVGDYVYLGGHRPVRGNYMLRQNGLYIQIHNPGMQNIAIVQNDRKFNPDKDIVEVAK